MVKKWNLGGSDNSTEIKSLNRVTQEEEGEESRTYIISESLVAREYVELRDKKRLFVWIIEYEGAGHFQDAIVKGSRKQVIK
jgi:hypothetical protein